MRLKTLFLILALGACGCKRQQGGTVPAAPKAQHPTSHNENSKMKPLDQVLGNLLETWDKRYTFNLDREKGELRLTVPNFELVATESSAEKIFLTFDEAGTRHRVECSTDEAPKVIEALLFPN
jgi:hypothetical protein